MIVKFEDFTLDAERVELCKSGVPVTIEPQVFDLITYLATHSDHVVDRDELIANVWRGRIVSDAAISTRINAARRALEDDGRSQSASSRPCHGVAFASSRMSLLTDRTQGTLRHPVS
jgi:DNA-binding winged helix-turn-helix (wHTH) protein